MNRYIIPILLVLIATGVYVEYIDPTYAKVVAYEAKITDLKGHIVEADNAKTQIDALLQTTEQFPPNYNERLRMLVPDTVDSTRLIIDVNEMAAVQGLHLKGPTVSQSQEAAKKGSASFVKHVMTFTVSAPYDAFRSLLSSLEYNLALRDVRSIGFSSSDNKDGVLVAHPEVLPYDYSFSITTYSLH